jgi:putative ABC transport system substrate-binding protein
VIGLFAAAAAGWIAFIAPDFPQSRSLLREYEARMAPALQEHDLVVRFVPVADDLAVSLDPPVTAALADKPRLIVAPAQHIAATAQRLSGGAVPVVFSSRVDPVRAGLATSLSRPGKNATGITYDVDIAYKQLELLQEIAPAARTVGVLADGIWLHEEAGPQRLARYERIFGVKIVVLVATSPEDLVARAASDEARRVDAWLVPITNYSGRARNEVVAAIRRTRKPVVYGRSFFADAGGLASYQEVISNPIEILADMSKQVLAGIPAGEIPVQRPRDFEMVLNFDEARELGIAVPRALVHRANRIVGAPPTP